MLYALFNDAGRILEYRHFASPPPALAVAKGLRWLPVFDVLSEPGPDEVIVGPVVTVEGEAVRRVWAVAPASVPERVTNYQARAALMGAGLFDVVNDAVHAAGGSALQAWEYANEITRHGVLVNAIAANVGMGKDQLDSLFRAAALIEA